MLATIYIEKLYPLHNHSPLAHIHTLHYDVYSFTDSTHFFATRSREHSFYGVDMILASWEIESRLDAVLELDEEGELGKS